MSVLDIVAIILVLCFIVYPIIWLVGLIKEIGDEVAGGIKKKAKKREVQNYSAPQSPVSYSKTDNEILNDPEFLRKIEYLRPYYRWMTLAGGTDPLLVPQIYFEHDGQIVLQKKGYDLWSENIKAYYYGTKWEEREKALELFGQDLFGEYVDEMKKVISFEYIADHLIELMKETGSTSDFCLTFSTYGNIKTLHERELFRHELQKTLIFETR